MLVHEVAPRFKKVGDPCHTAYVFAAAYQQPTTKAYLIKWPERYQLKGLLMRAQQQRNVCFVRPADANDAERAKKTAPDLRLRHVEREEFSKNLRNKQ